MQFFLFITYYFSWLVLTGFDSSVGSSFVALIVATFAWYIGYALGLFNGLYNPFRAFLAMKYFGWLVLEIVSSAWQVSKIAWSRRVFIEPSLQKVDSVQECEVGAMVYANSITLTPGTVTIGEKGGSLLVHALNCDFADGLRSGVMDQKIKNILRSKI